MSHNLNNRRRLFADVVSIDAWHDAFDKAHSKVDLHADVVFGTARLGGEPESPIRFRLSVRQAEIVVVIPELEPVSVVKNSVSRDSPKIRGRLTEIYKNEAKVNAKGRIAASASYTGVGASAAAEASIQAEQSNSRRLDVSSPVQLMIVNQSQTTEGHYRWQLKPGLPSPTLQGRPWNAADEARFKMVDQRKDRSKSLPPIVRVEVRCLREDLVIEDIQAKDKSIWEDAKSRLGFKNRLAAVESYIRDRLSSEGLEVTNLEDAFGQLTLGSVTAEST